MTGLQAMLEAFQSMMTHHRAMFLNDGNELFRAAAIIFFVLLGVRFQEHGDLHSVLMGVLQVTTCFVMIRFYVDPIPGVGMSFSGLLVGAGQDFAGRISSATADDMNRLLAGIQSNLNGMGLFSWLTLQHAFAYVMTWLAIGFFMIVEMFVVGIGFFATAALLTVGPLVIFSLLLPGLDWLFWSWLRCLLCYSFVGVFAALFIDAYSALIMNFVGYNPGLGKDTLSMGASLGAFVSLLISGGAVALFIPSLSAACFTGGGGGSSFWHFWKVIPRTA